MENISYCFLLYHDLILLFRDYNGKKPFEIEFKATYECIVHALWLIMHPSNVLSTFRLVELGT